jgi:Kef-type K+ transport system membrane component KefB
MLIKTIGESQACILFLAVLVLLIAALLGGKLVAFFKIPKVAGEIIGGIVVGPTVLGALFPEAYAYIFTRFQPQGEVVSVFYWIGLVLLMSSSGYDSSIRDFKGEKKIIGALVAGSTVLPLIAGYFISQKYFVDFYLGEAGNHFVFNVIFALACAVTSLPVISKIFMDLGLMRHRFAKIILTTATIQDLMLWVILSLASSMITKARVSAGDVVLHIIITLCMFAFALFAAPKLGRLKIMNAPEFLPSISVFFIICFFCIFIGSLFSVNIMYSAFVAGLIFKNIRTEEAVKAQSNLRAMCLAFFTPVYFAIVGLRIHITSDFSVAYFVVFFLIASFLELAGCLIAMKAIKLNWTASFNLGIAMNARGGPGIVLAMVTYDMGIINYEFFCVLIFTSLISSAIAGYWIDYINKKNKLLVLG